MSQQQDEKTREVINDAMTTVMMPVLDKILDKLDEHDEKFEKIEEKLEDIELTVNRIETRQKVEVERVDDHEVRIGKLEKAIN